MEPTLTYQEAIDLPKRCEKCPVIEAIGFDYYGYTATADEIVDALLNGREREYIMEMMVEHGYTVEAATAFLDRNADAVRESQKLALESIDSRRTMLADVGRSATAACSGALTMSARRDDKEVTVTICMSDDIDEINSHTPIEATAIERRTIGE